MKPIHGDTASAFKAGMIDGLPLAAGVAIYGIAFGILAARADLGGIGTGVMGAVVFAGSSQIVSVERLIAGAGPITALVAGLALNLRLILITASLRDELAGRPPWQVLLGIHLASDESWSLMHATRARGRPAGFAYLVGAGSGLFLAWIAATTSGAMFAQQLADPQALGLDFAFVAAFIAILRNLWRDHGDLLPWAASVLASGMFVLTTGIEPSWALVAGGIAGALTAALMPQKGRQAQTAADGVHG